MILLYFIQTDNPSCQFGPFSDAHHLTDLDFVNEQGVKKHIISSSMDYTLVICN